MLRELKVENLALIKDLSLSFEPGFNVLTGETGAGKSLLVDAVGLAIGARASTELVRQGAGEAVVEALFEPAGPAARQALDLALVERGLPTAKGVMIVRRLIGSGGRHRVYVNGSLATVATLAEIARGLVAVCGQHEHVSLTRPGEALALLDDYASATDPDFSQLRAAYAAAWHELQAARSGLSAFQEDPAARAERESFVRFQISELESLAPSPGEIEELEAEQRRLSSATRLQAITAEAEHALYSGDDAVAALLARTLRRLEEGAGLDPKLSPMLEPIASALAVISETGRDLGDYSRSIDSSPEGVAKVEGRLTSLKRLARRHGGDLSLACRALDSLREELCRLEDHDLRFEEARRRVEAAELEACRAAERLRAARSAAARSLDSEVAKGLEQLRMAGGRVALSVQRSEIGPSGADRVEIGLSSGPGLPLRPISKVASGGELSRLLLAFRRAIAEVDGVGTLVFDEADAGVGGAVAEAVGRLMAEVAKSRQVLCVTHLPQLAVHASHHIVVTKSVGGRGSGISATVVENESRVEELGRMLGGREITAATRANARDLLENATSSPTRKRPARRRPKPRASPLPLSAE